MWGEQVAKVIAALPPLIWALLAGYIVYLFRSNLALVFGRLTGFELFGVKLALSGGQAMSAAIELAQKHSDWRIEVPVADQQRALKRADRERPLLENAEILWVDDRPSNNRNEAKMLRSFGAMITFACNTEEALRALELAAEQLQPFHLILSDISRDLPVRDPKAGLAMLQRLKAEKVTLPVVFYVGKPDPEAGVPAGAFGLTHRPDELLHLALDALARTRKMG